MIPCLTISPSRTDIRLRKITDRNNLEINQELIEKIPVTEKEKNAILCRACKNKISSIDEMIEVNGNHRHVFKNPIGIVYKIACYQTATGCLMIGQPTAAHTWFPGFRWQLALCQKCFSHLGWFFQSVSDSFYGLISENLVEEAPIN